MSREGRHLDLTSPAKVGAAGNRDGFQRLFTAGGMAVRARVLRRR